MDSNSLKAQLNQAIQQRDLLISQRAAIDAQIKQQSDLVSQLNNTIPKAEAAEKQQQNVQSYNSRMPGNTNPVI
jgi:hypothetical protein